jgi:hypothetical protein
MNREDKMCNQNNSFVRNVLKNNDTSVFYQRFIHH